MKRTFIMFRKFFLAAILLSISSLSYAQSMTSESCMSNGGVVMELGGANICSATMRLKENKSDVYEGLGVGVATCQNPYSRTQCTDLFNVQSGIKLEPLLKRLSHHSQSEVLGCAKTYAVESDAFLTSGGRDLEAMSRAFLASMRSGIFGYIVSQFDASNEDSLEAAVLSWNQCGSIVDTIGN